MQRINERVSLNSQFDWYNVCNVWLSQNFLLLCTWVISRVVLRMSINMMPTSAWSLLRIFIFNNYKRLTKSYLKTVDGSFLARDAFVRTNLRDIAMMFVRLPLCQCGTGVHCDHTVHFSVDLSLLSVVQCLGTLTPKHVYYLLPTIFFQFHLQERWSMDLQTRREERGYVKVLIRSHYAASINTTTDDLE